jgi:hypothetical protein
MMWDVVSIMALMIAALLYAQKKHYEYLERKRSLDQTLTLDSELSEMLKEFQDYKKRVDVLTLKAGFKL